MSVPAAVWTMTYSASRRAHNHRCACCNRVVKDGETVVMARVADRKTKVVHAVSCADAAYAADGHYNYRDALEAWGMQHLAAVGYAEAKHFVDTAAICRA